MIRTEEILARIRKSIEEEEAAPKDAGAAPVDDSLPAIASRPELDYLNRNYALFDPNSPMQSHRALLGGFTVKFRWRVRHLVLGVLDRYFEKERLFLLELVRFTNALAERSDRLLRELTERTQALAERNDLFLGALDLRVEAVEAAERMRGEDADSAAVLAEMAAALAGDSAARLRPAIARCGGRVLVLGCGDGAVLGAFAPEVRATGVEASPTLVERARAAGHEVEHGRDLAVLAGRAGGGLDGILLLGLPDRHALSEWPGLFAAALAALGPKGLFAASGLRAPGDLTRGRWLLEHAGFAVEHEEALAPTPAGEIEHLLVARRGGA